MEKTQKKRRCFPRDFVAEIIFFVFKISDSLLEPSLRLFIYQEVCLRFANFRDKSTCLNISKYPEKEVELQAQAALYLTVYRVLVNLPALFLCAFCGSWSDRVGRKSPIVISSISSIVGVVFFLVSANLPLQSYAPPDNGNTSSTFERWNETSLKNPLNLRARSGTGLTIFIVMMFCGSLFRGMSGKGSVVTMAVHSHVSDVSDNESRTERLGCLLSMNFFGVFVGSLMIGICLEKFGFNAIFSIVILLQIVCIVLAAIFMENKNKKAKIDASETISSSADDSSIDQNGTNGTNLFHWKNFCDFLALLRNFPSARVFFFFLLIVIQQGFKSGEVDVTLLYTMKAPLNWNKSLYGYFLATDYACLGLATSVLLPLLIRRFEVHDISLAIVGVAFKVVRVTILALSTTTWMVFLSAVLGCPSALIISCLKSLVSKSFHTKDLGKIFALLSGCETFSNLIGNIAFNNVYVWTLSFYSGFLFCFDAFVFFFLLLGLIYVGFKESEEDDQKNPLWDAKLGAKDDTDDYGTIKKIPQIVLHEPTKTMNH